MTGVQTCALPISEQRGEDEQVRDAGQPEHRHGEDDDQSGRGQDLRGDQQSESTGAVSQDAGDQLETEQRRPLRQAEIAEGERIVGQLPHDPREGDVLRSVPEDVEDQPDPVETVVPCPEGGERRQAAGRRPARRPSL